MASALATFDAVLKERYPLRRSRVCPVCDGRNVGTERSGDGSSLYDDLEGHCRENPDAEHLAMSVMES